MNAASVLHIFLAGVLDRPSRWTRFAVAAALTESAELVANGGRRPLTGLVEHVGAKSGRVSDILLPRWFAERIAQLVGPPLIVALIALLVNAWHRADGLDRRRGPDPPGAGGTIVAEAGSFSLGMTTYRCIGVPRRRPV